MATINGEDPKTNGGYTKINFGKALLNGLSYGDIYETSVQNGLPVVTPTIEEFTELAKGSIPDDQIESYYSEILKHRQFYDSIDKANLSTSGYRIPDTPAFKDISVEKDIFNPTKKILLSDRYFNLPGQGKVELYSGDKEASMRGVFKNKEGVDVPLSLEKYADNYLKRVEDINGNSWWQEADDNEFIPPELIKGASGDRELTTNNVFTSAVKGLWQGSVPLLAKGIGTIAGATGQGWEYIMDNKPSIEDIDDKTINQLKEDTNKFLDTVDIDPTDKWYYQFNKNLQNWGNRQSTKNIDEMQGMFADWNSGIYTLMNGVSQVLGVVATGAVVGGGMRAVGFASQFPTLARGISFTSANLIGSSEAMAATQDELLKNGLDYTTTNKWLAGYGLATFGSEMMFGGYAEALGYNIASKYINRVVGKNEIGKIANEVYDQEVIKLGVSNAKELSEKGLKKLVRNVYKGVWDRSKELQSSTAGRILKPGIQEGLEEYAEGIAYWGIGTILNNVERLEADKYNELLGNYDLIVDDPTNKESGYRIQNKYDSGDFKRLSEREFESYKQQDNYYNDILNGKNTIETQGITEGAFWEQGVAAFASSILAFGMLGNLAKPGKYEDNLWELGYAISEKPQKRQESLQALQQLKDEGYFKFSSDPDGEVSRIMKDIDLTTTLIKELKVDKDIHKTIRGNKYLTREAVNVYKGIKDNNEKITQLNALLDQETIENDIPELGVKKGMTKEEISSIVKPLEQKNIELNKQLSDIVDVEKADNKIFDGRKLTREQLDTVANYIDINGNTKQKTTSKRYSEMLFDILSIKFFEEQKERAKLKAKYENTGLSEAQLNKKIEDEFNKALPDIYKRAKFYVLLNNGSESLYEEHSKVFKYYRDKHLVYVNELIQQNKQALESNISEIRQDLFGEDNLTAGINKFYNDNIKDIEGDVNELTGITDDLERGLKILDIEDRIENISSRNRDIDKVIDFNEFTTDEQASISNTLDRLGGIVNNLRSNTVVTNDKVSKLLDNIEGSIPSLKDKTKQKARQFDETIDNPDKNTINEAFRNMVNDYQYVDKKTMSISQPIEQLIKLWDKQTSNKEGDSSVENPDLAITILDNYLDFLTSLDYYANSNIELVQNRMENNKDYIENSPLQNNNGAKLTKDGLEQWSIEKDAIINKVNELKPKIQKPILDRKKNDFKVTLSYVNTDILFIDKFLEINNEIKALNVATLAVVNKIRNDINNILEKEELPNNEKVKSLNNLLSYYLKLESTDNDKRLVTEKIMQRIERESIKMKEALSGKVLPFIQFLNSKTYLPYNFFDPSDNNLFIDRKINGRDANLDKNNGLLSSDVINTGFRNLMSFKLDVARDKETVFFYQSAINMLNDINVLGNNAPTQRQVIDKIREVIRDNDGIDIGTYEQERMLTSLISFLYSPSNEYIKDNTKVKENVSEWHGLNDIINNIIYAKGYSGTGKTTYIIANLIRVYDLLEKDNKTKDRKLKITIVVPSDELKRSQEKNLNQSTIIQGEIKKVKDLIDLNMVYTDEIMSGTKTIDPSDIVLLDEATLLPVSAKGIFKDIHEKSKSSWIVFGDDAQPTPFIDKNILPDGTFTYFINSHIRDIDENYLIKNISRFTNPLTEIHRTSSPIFSNWNDMIRQSKYNTVFQDVSVPDYMSYPSRWKIKQDGTGKVGYEAVTNVVSDPENNNVINKFIEYLEQYSEQRGKDKDGKYKTLLILLRTEDRDKLLTKGDSKILALKDQIKTIEYDYFGLVEDKDLAGNTKESRRNELASGLEADNIFLAVQFSGDNIHPFHLPGNYNIKQLERNLLLGISRQTKYLVAIGKPVEPQAQEADDSIVLSDPNKDKESFKSVLRTYLVGDDEQETGGRYGVLLEGVTPYSTTKSREEAPVLVHKTDRLANPKELIDDNDIQKELERLRILSNNKIKYTHISDVVWEKGDKTKKLDDIISILKDTNSGEAALEQAKTDYQNRKYPLFFRHVISYVLSSYNNESVDTINNHRYNALEVLKSFSTDGYKKIDNPDAYFKSIVWKVQTNNEVLQAISTGLSVVDPSLTIKIGKKNYITHPSMVTIVGYTEENGKKIPIVDIHNIRTRRIIDKPSDQSIKIAGGHMALLNSYGYKINNVIEYHLNIEDAEDNIEIDQSKKYIDTYIYDTNDKINAMNAINADLKIKSGLENETNKTIIRYDDSVLATPIQLAEQKRMLSEYRGYKPGMSILTNKGNINIERITYKLKDGKIEYFVKLKNKDVVPFNQFESDYKTDKPKTRYYEQAIKYDGYNSLWNTSAIYVFNPAIKDTILKEIGSDNFFNVGNNPIVKIRHLILSVSKGRNVVLSLAKDEKGISINPETGKVTSKDYDLRERYAALLSLSNDEITDIVNINIIKESLKSINNDYRLGYALKEEGDYKKLFNDLGLNIIGVGREAEYDFTTKVSKGNILDNSNKKQDVINYIETKDLEDPEAVLKSIFDDKSFRGQDEIQDNEEGANVDVYREKLIKLNKATLHLRRVLFQGGNIETTISDVDNGRIIRGDKIPIISVEDTTNTILNRIKDVERVYGGFEYDDNGGKYYQDKAIGGYATFDKLYALVWRYNRNTAQKVYFDGRETTFNDLDKYQKEIENIKFQPQIDDLLRDLDRIHKVEDRQTWIQQLRDFHSSIDSTEFMNFIRHNGKYFIEIMKSNQDIAELIHYNQFGDEELGTIDITAHTSPKAKIEKALHLIKILKSRFGQFRDYNDKPITLYQPIRINGEVASKNLVTSFSTLSQPGLYFDYEPEISLDKERIQSTNTPVIPIERSKEELNRILGSIADTNVFINPGFFKSPTTNKDVWGNVRNMLLTLSDVNGYTDRTVARHEAIHFVMLYLINPNKHQEIMNYVVKEMKKKGYKLNGSNRENSIAVYEYIADRFENRNYNKNTLLGRFINWLRSVVNRLTNSTLNMFFDEVNNGNYASSDVVDYGRDFSLDKKVKNEYTSKEAQKHVMDIFGDSMKIYSVIHTHLYKAWNDSSVWGRDLTVTKDNGTSTLKRVLDTLQDKAMAVGDKIIKFHDYNGTEIKKKVSELTKDDYTYSTINRFGTSNQDVAYYYELYQFNDRYTTNVLLQMMFPYSDMEVMDRTSFGSNKTLTHSKNNDETNPMDSKSIDFKIMLSSIPLYSYKTKKSLGVNRYANFFALDKMLTMVYLDIKESNDTNILTEVFKKLESLLPVLSDENTKNTLYSFLLEYGEKVSSKDNMKVTDGIIEHIGYLDMWRNENRIVNQIPTEYREAFKEKIKYYENFIHVLNNHYYSLKTNIINYVDFTHDQPLSKSLLGRDKRYIKANLRDNSNVKLIDKNTFLKSSVEDALSNRYLISNNSITIVNKNDKYVGIDINKPDNATVETIVELLGFMGLDINVSVIKNLRDKKKWKDVLNNVFHMMLTLRVAKEIQRATNDYANKTNEENINLNKLIYDSNIMDNKNPDSIYSVLNKYYKGIYRSDIINFREDSVVLDNKNNARSLIIPLPSMFYKFIEETLAKELETEINRLNQNMQRKVSGSYSYIHPLSSYLFDLFPQKENTGYEYGKKVIVGLEKLSNQEKKVHPLINNIDNTFKYNNSILNNTLKFDYIQVFDGIKAGNRYSEYDKITPFDFIKTLIEGFNIIALSSQASNAKTTVANDLLSDKPMLPLYKMLVKSSDPGIQTLVSNIKYGNQWEALHIEMNQTMLINYMMDLARYYKSWNGKYGIDKNNDFIKIFDLHKSNKLTYGKLKEIFQPRFNELLNIFDQYGYRLPLTTDNFLQIEDKGTALESYNIDNNWHPIVELAFWSHLILNENISHLVRGPQAMYGTGLNGIINYIKRGSGLVAPGNVLTGGFDETENPMIAKTLKSALGLNSRVLAVEDFNYVGENGEIIKNALDGASLLMPWTDVFMRMDSGMNIGTLGQGAIKNVLFDFNAVTNQLYYFKFAQFAPTSLQYQGKFWKQMVAMGLGEVGHLNVDENNNISIDNSIPTFLERFEDNFQQARIDVSNFLLSEVGREYKDKVLGYVVFKSAYKVGGEKFHSIGSNLESVIMTPNITTDMNNDSNIMQVPNSKLRHQVVTHQETEEQRSVFASQLSYILAAGDHNQNDYNLVKNGLSALIDIAINNLRVTDKDGKIREVVADYVSRRIDTTKAKELVKNPGIDLNIFRDNVYMALANYVEEYTKPFLPGQTYIQAPSMVELYFMNDGTVYTPNEYNKLSEKEIADAGGLIEDKARPLRALNYNSNKYNPTEIIIPFNYLTKFGITKDMTLAKSFTISDGVTSINLYNKSSEQIAELITTLEIDDIIDNLPKSQKDVILSLNIGSESNEDINWMKLVKYYSSLNEAMNTMVVRRPTTSAASASSARIVAFDNESDNTVWIPSELNELTGADYDIDPLQVYFWNINKELDRNFDYNNDVESAAQNSILLGYHNYYNNIVNKGFILNKIDLTTLKEAAEKKEMKLWSSDLSSLIKAKEFSHSGRNLIGHFMNLTNFIYRLWSIPIKTRQKTFNIDELSKLNVLVTTDEQKLLDTTTLLQKLSNAATDNEKLGGALGRLNINEDTSSLVAGMVFSGLTEQEIYDNLDREDVYNAIRKMYGSKDITTINTTSGNLNYKKKHPLSSVLEDNDLINYALQGEALLRLMNIINLQRDIPANINLFKSKVQNIEFSLGRTLNDYINNPYDKEFIDVDIEKQQEWIKETHPRAIQNIGNDATIRKIINVPLLMKEDSLSNFHRLLEVVNIMNDYMNEFDVYKDEYIQKMLIKKLGVKGLLWENEFESYVKAFDEQLIGHFLYDNYTKLQVGNNTYDLSTQRGRYDFVNTFPDYVRTLKKGEDSFIRNNAFIVGLEIGALYGSNIPSVGFRNPFKLEMNIKSSYRDAFKMLPGNIRTAFGVYNLIMNGFQYTGNTLTDLLDNQMEIEYSRWYNGYLVNFSSKSFKLDDGRTVMGDEIFTNNLILVYKELAKYASYQRSYDPVTGKNRIVGVTDKTEFQNVAKSYEEPSLVRYPDKYVNALSNNTYNTYLAENMETDKKLFSELSYENIKKLRESGEFGRWYPYRTRVRNKKYGGTDIWNTIYSGDYVMLPDGSTGVIYSDDKYGRDIRIIQDIQGNKKVESRLSKESSKVSYNLLHEFISKVQAAFPNIDVVFVNNNNATSNSIAWIENGKVYFNTDKVQLDTPIHEYIGHILVDLLEHTNPALYSKLEQEAISLLNGIDGKKIQKAYNDKTGSDLIKEVIANMIGWHSEDAVRNFLMNINANGIDNKKNKLWSFISGIIGDIKNFIMGMINKFFGVRINLDNIQTSSLKDIATSAVQAILKGDVISYVTSDTFSNLSNAAKYESRLKIEDVKINSVKDLYNTLVLETESEERKIMRMRAYLRITGDKVESNLYGEEEQVSSSAPDEKIKQILDKTERKGEEYKNAVNKTFNSKKDPTVLSGETFGLTKYGTQIFSDEVMKSLTHRMEYDRITNYVRYSDLKNIPELKHLYNEKLEGFNPTIAIEGVTKDMIRVSIYDLNFGLSTVSPNNILDRLITNSESLRKQIRLTNSTHDVRKLLASLISIDMMKRDNKVWVNQVSYIDVSKNTIVDHSIDPAAIVETLKGFKQVPEFMSAIKDTDILSLFSNPEYYSHVDYMRMLETYYTEAKLPDDYYYGVKTIFNNDDMSIKKKYQIISLRIKHLIKDYKIVKDKSNDENSKYRSETIKELQYLTGALLHLRDMGHIDSQLNPFWHMNDINMKIYDAGAIGSDYVQSLRNIILESSNRIVKQLDYEKKSLDKLYGDAKKIYESNSWGGKQYFYNISQDVWDVLTAKVDVFDANGNRIKKDIGFIYWTKDENECITSIQKQLAREAKQLNLDDRLIAIGRKVTDHIDKWVERSIYNDIINSNNYNRDAKREYEIKDKPFTGDIKIEDTMYQKGMLPILPKTYTEQMSTGSLSNIWKGVKGKVEAVADVYDMFDLSTKQGVEKHTEFMKLTDLFMWQWGYKAPKQHELTEIGHRKRANMLGLDVYDDGKGNPVYKLIDDNKNQGMSKNINLILESLTISALRQEEYEGHVLPTINGIKVFLQDKLNFANNKEEETNLKNTIDYLNLYTMQGIKGEMKKIKGDIAGIKVHNAVMSVMAVSTPAVMAFNFNIGLVGAVSNMLFAFTEGIANQFVERGIFTASELSKATGLFISDFGKVRHLMKENHVMAMTEFDILRHQLRRVERNSVLTTFWASATNFSADYFARGIVMTAQMLHDGSWDAFNYNESTDKMEYNPKKDGRWSVIFNSGANKDSEEYKQKKALYDGMKLSVYNDGVWGQEKDKELIWGYDLKLMRKFKVLSDRYVTGAYDNLQKNLMASFLFGRLWGMFKNWFTTRYTNAYQKRNFNEELGRYVAIKDNNGHYIAKWERLEVEGYINTMMEMSTFLFKGKYKDFEWTDARKANGIKWITSVSLFTTMMILYSAFVKHGDDDDRELAVLPDWRLIRNIKYGTYSLMVLPTIWEFIRSPFAAIDIVGGWFFDPFGGLSFGNVPFRKTIDTVLEPFDQSIDKMINEEE